MDAIKEYLRAVDRLEHGEINLGEYEKLCEPLRDVVKVIRCKYCKYHGATIEEQPTASIMCAHMHDNDYCSYGKRRN